MLRIKRPVVAGFHAETETNMGRGSAKPQLLTSWENDGLGMVVLVARPPKKCIRR
jgi:hypothetical protein